MREIDSTRRGEVHSHLSSQKVIDAFNQNIADMAHNTSSAYSDGKSDSKDSIKWTLKDMYFNKCAFCESSIKNEVGDIEHFRPKNSSENPAVKCDKTFSYYWLAFSWDNLIPSCSRCNGKKSNCFDIEGDRASYENEDLTNLHDKIKEYNSKEQPKLLHPEHDKFEDEIVFNLKGEIENSSNDRINYTVKICNLNRTNLTESRETVFTDLKNKLEKQYLKYLTTLEKLDNNDEDEAISITIELLSQTVEELYEKSDIKYEYSLVRKFIIRNFESILDMMGYNTEENEEKKLLFLVALETFIEKGD